MSNRLIKKIRRVKEFLTDRGLENVQLKVMNSGKKDWYYVFCAGSVVLPLGEHSPWLELNNFCVNPVVMLSGEGVELWLSDSDFL